MQTLVHPFPGGFLLAGSFVQIVGDLFEQQSVFAFDFGEFVLLQHLSLAVVQEAGGLLPVVAGGAGAGAADALVVALHEAFLFASLQHLLPHWETSQHHNNYTNIFPPRQSITTFPIPLPPSDISPHLSGRLRISKQGEYIINSNIMSSNQVEIKFMINQLMEWNNKLGGSDSKRSLAASEFDYLQEEFLAKRHLVEKCQDVRQKEGYTTTNANIGFQIRDGLTAMRELLGKLKEEHRRLTKKKKDTAEILERKLKIVDNCQLLLKDLEDRENGDAPRSKHQAVTLTDLKAKLLKQIDENYEIIHQTGSDGKISEVNEHEEAAKKRWKAKDEEFDVKLDEITVGLKKIRGKVVQMNDQQDEINAKTKKADKKVGEVGTRIKKDNDKLKEIIKKYKSSRCCLFIALFLLLAGLIVCIVKLLI